MLIHLQASVNKSAQNYFAKTVQSAKGKRRHLGSIPEDSGSMYISQLFKPSEGHVLVRKARKLELHSSNTF